MTETEQRISKGEAEKLYLTQRDLGKTHDESREYVRRETGHDIQVPIKKNEVTPESLTPTPSN